MVLPSVFVILSEVSRMRNTVEGSDLFNGDLKPVRGQVFPVGISPFDERVLLGTSPALHLFFPRDGIANIKKVRAIHKNDATVLFRETGVLASAMLGNTK